MNAFTVYKICEHEHRQLLIVQPISGIDFQVCVYDEHSGNTLMRLTRASIEEFERAISIVKNGS